MHHPTYKPNHASNTNDTYITQIADMVCYSKDYYFDSYAHFGIHEEMLKDEVKNNILGVDLL